MNAISESTILRVPVRRQTVSRRSIDRPLRLCGAGYEIILEVWETVVGAFALPLLRPPGDRSLEHLDDCLLNDIGYARRAGPKADPYL